MIFELGTSGLLVLSRPAEFALGAAILALLLNVAIWAATFFISVPLHNQLDAHGFDAQVIGQLVATNWLRTLAWTARLGILTFFLFRLLK